MRYKVFVTAVVLSLSMLLLRTPIVPITSAGEKGYEYYVIGNPGDVVTKTTPGFLLMGGGRDVVSAFRWMIEKSGGGDFVVLRATGTDAYNRFIYDLGGVDSVETLILHTPAAASDPFVLSVIRNAEALFIAGGRQSDYVALWKGTPVEKAIEFVAAKGAPVGGTSAGLAVLGDFLFSAENGTVTSSEALSNPYNDRMTIDRDFLKFPLLHGLITDSHLSWRDRVGRLVAFLARVLTDGWTSEAKGIGVDEATAVAVEADGSSALYGDGSAYFLRPDKPPEVCEPGLPLTFLDVSVYRMSGIATFNLKTWSGRGGHAYRVSAKEGVLTSTRHE